MALITIEDLPQSEDLDHEAMRSILGGGSIAPPLPIDQAGAGGGRIVEYPPGFSDQRPCPSALLAPSGISPLYRRI